MEHDQSIPSIWKYFQLGLILFLIVAKTLKYLHSDWLMKVQYY